MVAGHQVESVGTSAKSPILEGSTNHVFVSRVRYAPSKRRNCGYALRPRSMRTSFGEGILPYGTALSEELLNVSTYCGHAAYALVYFWCFLLIQLAHAVLPDKYPGTPQQRLELVYGIKNVILTYQVSQSGVRVGTPDSIGSDGARCEKLSP